MINEYNNLIKEKKIIDLKINEIRDFMLRNLINEFNNNNKDIELIIQNDFDENLYLYYSSKKLNLRIKENNKEIPELTIKNLIRKGKITMEGIDENNNYIDIKVNLNYTNKFKDLHKEFLEIYNKKDFEDFVFNSKKPIIYKYLENNLKQSLKDDNYLNYIIKEEFIFCIADMVRKHSILLIPQNNEYSMIYKDKETNEQNIRKFKIDEKFIDNKINIIDRFNFNNYSIKYIKDLILKSNIFNDNTKEKDINIKFLKEEENYMFHYKKFKDLHNCIRNYLKFSPENSLIILAKIVEINKKSTEITSTNEKLELLSLMGLLRTYDKNKNLELYNNEDNIINNLNESYKKSPENYIKTITNVLSYIEKNIEDINILNEFYNNVKNKEYKFQITNLKTNEIYVDKINFSDFVDKYVLDKEINLENEIEMNI